MTSKAKHGDKSKAVEPDSTREHEIRRRAFEIYLERGSEPGRDLEDWLQAERELTTDKSKTASDNEGAKENI
jgi:Protein of unknown function (DUF2934)